MFKIDGSFSGSGPGSGDALEQVEAELAKTQKLLSTEKLLKQQAVNKLAEIMNRKDFLNPGKNKNKTSSSSQVSGYISY